MLLVHYLDMSVHLKIVYEKAQISKCRRISFFLSNNIFLFKIGYVGLNIKMKISIYVSLNKLCEIVSFTCIIALKHKTHTNISVILFCFKSHDLILIVEGG